MPPATSARIILRRLHDVMAAKTAAHPFVRRFLERLYAQSDSDGRTKIACVIHRWGWIVVVVIA